MAARLLVFRRFGSLLLLLLAVTLTASAAGPIPGQDPVKHDIVVKGRDYEFTPSRIDVGLGDIVKITLVAEDIPYSFTVDAYRISKRVTPAQPVTFEFRADRAGTFPFYCDLTSDDQCRKMRGEMVVTAR